jgi:hypothetical protein
MKPRGGKRKHKAIDFSEDLPLLHLQAAGIDVGDAEHYVPPGRDPQPVQRFGSFTADLHRMVGLRP